MDETGDAVQRGAILQHAAPAERGVLAIDRTGRAVDADVVATRLPSRATRRPQTRAVRLAFEYVGTQVSDFRRRHDAIVDGAAFLRPQIIATLGTRDAVAIATGFRIQALRDLLALEISAGADQTIVEIVELIAGIRRAAGSFDGQIDTADELIVDEAAIGLVFAGAFDRFARARFDTSLPYLWIAQATFRTRATSFETETIDTGGATVTGVFGRTRVRAEALVDANRARRGIAASPAFATIGETAAFAGDADARPGESGAADLRFRIAPRTAAIGLLVADKARIGAIGIGAAGAVDRSVIADPAVGAAIAAGEQLAAGVDATDIRHLTTAATEGLLRATELVAAPADSVATPVELAAKLVGPAALRSIGRRANML